MQVFPSPMMLKSRRQTFGTISARGARRGAHPRMTADHPKTFREIFCERHECDATGFKEALFRTCLPRRARILAFALGGFNGRFFAPDRDLISHVGEATTIASIREEIRDFFMHSANARWLRRALGVRISTRRIQSVARRYLLGREPVGAPN